MATKINESVWGPVPETGPSLRVAPNTLGTCYKNGTFDPSDINTMDKSIVPWGVPYCGLGGMSYLKKLRMPIPMEGTDNQKAGTLTTFEIEEFVGTNNPIALMMTGNINSASKANWFSHRMSGAVNSSETAFTSNAACDRDTSIPAGGSYQLMWQFKPIVYLDYQKVMVQVQAVILWDKAAGTRIRTTNLSNYPASGKTWDDYELLGFQYEIYYKNGNSWTPNGYYTPIPVNEKDTSKFVLDRYFGQEVRPQKWTPYTFCAQIKTTIYGDSGSYQIASTAITKEADSETLYNKTDWTPEFQSYGNYINGSQTFDNVSYSMEKKCGFVSGGVWFEIVKGSEMPGSDYYGANIQMGVYYKIKDYEPGTSKAAAWAKIIAHEMAFLGLPFQIKISGDSGTPATTVTIADDDVFLPIFDMDHMVTTGRYTTELTEKQTLPNYAWNDIFDSTMPNWDSSYNPPKPGPGPGPEPGGETPWDDNPITRIQEGYWTGFGGNTYVSSARDFKDALDLVQSVASNHLSNISAGASLALNNYLEAEPGSEDQQEKWGIYLRAAECLESAAKTNSEIYTSAPNTNYTDCVLSIIRYPFDIRSYFNRDGASTEIKWGHITVNPSANADIWKVNGYQTGQIVQGGSLYVEKRYHNFLNYAPYTTAELYIPYCGSVPIDLEVFAGHVIDVKYLVDWFSGSCLALIYRDSVVVDQIPGQIGTSVGIVAEDIQSYQNAMFNGSQTLKAQKAALRSSAVRGMGESMDAISGAIGNVATTVLGGQPSDNAQSSGGSFAKGFSTGTGIAQNYQNVKTAKYNLDHTTIDFKQIGSNGPSVGSWNEQVCRLVLYYPTFLEDYDPAVYGHTVGFACLYNKTLGNFSGLTICSSVDTTGLTDATESEKTLLEEALKSGAYL